MIPLKILYFIVLVRMLKKLFRDFSISGLKIILSDFCFMGNHQKTVEFVISFHEINQKNQKKDWLISVNLYNLLPFQSK